MPSSIPSSYLPPDVDDALTGGVAVVDDDGDDDGGDDDDAEARRDIIRLPHDDAGDPPPSSMPSIPDALFGGGGDMREVDGGESSCHPSSSKMSSITTFLSTNTMSSLWDSSMVTVAEVAWCDGIIVATLFRFPPEEEGDVDEWRGIQLDLSSSSSV
jgi:hypothetical protein